MGAIPGARYKRELGAWNLPASWASCVGLRGRFRTQLEVGPKLSEWAWNERRNRVEPVMRIRDALHSLAGDPYLDRIEEGTHLKLFPYQRVDTEFLVTNKRALLANPPGLGKTGVTIRTLQLLRERGDNPFPAIIVCPNSLKFTVWKDGFAQWAPEVTVAVVDGSAATRRKTLKEKADVYIINWDSVRLHSNLAPYGTIHLTDAERTPKELNALGHRTVIMDEAHRLKDPRAKQTRATWAIAHQAVYRYALTGTPATNDIGDLWSLLHCIEPDWFPARTKFLDLYAQMSHGYWGGAQVVGINPATRDELFSLVDPLMRRVPKEAALPQLPPKLPVQYRHTPMTTGQQKAYDQMRDMMVAQLNEILVAPNPLSKLTRLMQFAAASAELSEVKTRVVLNEFRVTLTEEDILTIKAKYGDDIVGSEDQMMSAIRDHFNGSTKRRARFLIEDRWFEPDQVVQMYSEVEEEYQDVLLTDPSSKVDDMMDLLDEMGDEPLVVAAVSRRLIELAAKRLDKHKISHGLITGAQTPLERQAAVNLFQDGKIRVILLTLGAGAEGITLTRANTMLFMQESYSEVQNAQAEDRVHRIGSEGHAEVRIIKQVTPNSVEENKILVLQDKRARLEDIVRDRETLLKLLGEPAAPKGRGR